MILSGLLRVQGIANETCLAAGQCALTGATTELSFNMDWAHLGARLDGDNEPSAQNFIQKPLGG